MLLTQCAGKDGEKNQNEQGAVARHIVTPRMRFSPTKNQNITREGCKRSYIFDSIKVATPGQEIARKSYFAVLDESDKFNYILSSFVLVYLGRTSINNIKISYSKYLEGNGVVVDSSTKNIDYFLENPQGVTTIRLGDLAEPTVTIDVTLEESDLWYRITGDYISPVQ